MDDLIEGAGTAQRIERILESINDAFYALDDAWRFTFVNRRFEAASGKRREELIGRCIWELFPRAIGSQDRQEHLRAARERRPISFETVSATTGRWTETTIHPDDDGLSVYLRDIEDRKRAEDELREERSKLETLNRAGAALVADLDLERIVQRVTDAATELSGAQFGAFFYNLVNERGESYMLYTLSGVPREAFAKFPMPRNTAVFDPTFRGEGIVRVDDIRNDPRYGKNAPHYGMPKGHLPVRSYLAVPVISRSGEVLGGLFFGHKTPGVFTERVEGIVRGIAAQAAIAIDNARLYQAQQTEIAQRKRAQEELSRQLALTKIITDNTVSSLFMVDRHGHPTFMNPAAEKMTGYRLDEIKGRPLHDAIHHSRTDGRPFPMEECPIDRASMAPLPIRDHEDVFIRKDGTFFPVSCAVAPLEANGAAAGAVLDVVDITERKRAEDRQKLLLDELNHRVKNTLATVQSIALQTLGSADTLAAFHESFSARLMSLSQAHNLLTRENWDGAALRDVVLETLAPYREAERARVVIEGPDVRLGPAAALALGMAFHELATNAGKYGALSVPGGRVEVHWARAAARDGGIGLPRIELLWRETGGPRVRKPSRKGFGARLIERGLAHELAGEVRLDFDPDGVRCRIEIPLSERGGLG